MDSEMEDETTPRRRGRPRGSKTKRRGGRITKETVTRQEFDGAEGEDEEESEDGIDRTPLFGSDGETGIVRIRVTRTDPHEGMLGYLDDPMAATEKDISERWGGSSYLVQAVGATGRIVKSKVVKIAGDPVFAGTMAEAQWRKSRERLLPPAAAAAQGGLSITDLLQLMREQQTEVVRMENERREREAAADRLHAEKMRQLAEDSDRRRKQDEEERERRRQRDDEERDRRRQAAQEEADRRQQAFMQQTISMLQQSSQQALEFVKATTAAAPKGNTLMEAVQTIAAIKDAFGGDGGGGDQPMDTMSLLAKHGGEWLNGIGNAVASVVQEAKGNKQPIAAPPPQATPQRLNPIESLPLPPSLAPKVATLVGKLAARGLNPELELNALVDKLNSQLDSAPPPGTPVAAQIPQPSPVAVPQQPVNGHATPPPSPAMPPGVVMMRFGRKPQTPPS